jgi:hypothetical protein
MITDSEPEALDKVALTTTLYKNIVTASKVRPNPENLVPEMWPEIANQKAADRSSQADSPVECHAMKRIKWLKPRKGFRAQSTSLLCVALCV